jgi:hypothetical protein
MRNLVRGTAGGGSAICPVPVPVPVPALLALLLVAVVLGCSSGEPTKGTSSVAVPFAAPTADVPFIETADVVLDGALNEEAWAKAATVGPFVGARNGRPLPGPLQGNAKLFWTDTHLYVAFEIQDDTVRGGFPDNAVDPHLWERDTAELMIDPDGADNRDYYELQINPQGLVFDSRFDDYNQPKGGPAGPFGHETWSSGVERRVLIHGSIDDDTDSDKGYTIEARIPFASFDRAKRSPPAAGDTWKVNLYAMQDNGGVAWSPILGEGNFHTVRHFGQVTFVI